MADEAREGTGFLCHTSMTKGGREQTHDRNHNVAAMRPKQACPGTASVDTVYGSRGAMCTMSAQTWFAPEWVTERRINSRIETASCAASSQPAGATYVAM